MGLALTSGPRVYGEFPADTAPNFIEAANYFLQQAGWQLVETVAASASGVLSYPSGPQFGGITITIDGIGYSLWTTINNLVPNQIAVGANQTELAQHIVAALNADPSTAGTAYSSATTAHPTCEGSSSGINLTITARVGGPGGNGIGVSGGTLGAIGIGKLVDGGYKLQAVSPQVDSSSNPLTVYLYIFGGTHIYDLSHPYAQIQLISVANSSKTSAANGIELISTRRCRIIANPCQFFIYTPGVDVSQYGSNVQGGVPYVPGTGKCHGEIPAIQTDECWWYSSDQGGIFDGITPRTMLLNYGRLDNDRDSFTGTFAPNMQGCWNGFLNSGAGSLNAGAPGFCCMAPTGNIDFSHFHATVSQALWVGDVDMEIEPFIAWGLTINVAPEIRGQIWDAWIFTKQAAMDATYTRDTIHVGLDDLPAYWIGYTDRYKFGTLALLVPSLTPVAYDSGGAEMNYAY